MELFTSREAADFMKISIHTLEKWRALEIGPVYVRAGKQARYDRETLETWLMSRTEKEKKVKKPVGSIAADEPEKDIKYLTTEEAADLLNHHKITLAKWRMQGKGPAFQKEGKRVFYDSAVIEAWKRENKHN